LQARLPEGTGQSCPRRADPWRRRRAGWGSRQRCFLFFYGLCALCKDNRGQTVAVFDLTGHFFILTGHISKFTRHVFDETYPVSKLTGLVSKLTGPVSC
jgi:hypothetical protein